MDDNTYHRQRMAAETDIARRTANPDIRLIHERLRDEYARRVASFERSSPPS